LIRAIDKVALGNHLAHPIAILCAHRLAWLGLLLLRCRCRCIACRAAAILRWATRLLVLLALLARGVIVWPRAALLVVGLLAAGLAAALVALPRRPLASLALL